MMPSPKPESAQPAIIVLIVAVAVCIVTSLLLMPYIPDDSYISFRYAENLVNGSGLTFNPGEPPVEAYSNFLWILLCAVVSGMGLSLPGTMTFVGVVLALLNVFVLWLLYRRRECPPLQMLWPLLLLASSGPFIMYAVSGLEMPLYALLLLLMMLWLDLALESGRITHWILLAVTGFLLSLCRPEGVAAFPLIAAAAWWLGRPAAKDRANVPRNALAAATGIFVGLVVAYHIWRVSYFGEFLPTPFLSKGGGGKTVFNAWAHNLEDYFVVHGDYFPPLGFYFVAFAVAGFAGLTRAARGAQPRVTEVTALFLVVAYSLVYVNFVDWMPGMRYYSPLLALTLLPAIHLLDRFFTASKKLTSEMRRTFLLTGAALFLLSFSVVGALRIITQRIETSNQECLVKLGKWIRDVVPPGAVLAMSDVGAVPYYSQLRTVDIHPESLTDRHIATHGLTNEYFFGTAPDVVVIPSRSVFLTKFYPEHYSLTSDKQFQRIYRLVGVSRYDWQNDRSYWVYVSRVTPPLSEAQWDAFPHGIGTIKRVMRNMQ